MLRRRFIRQSTLLAGALGSTGCLQRSAESSGNGSEFASRTVSIEGVEGVPESVSDGQLSVELLDSEIMPEGTATVQTTITNRGSEVNSFDMGCRQVLGPPIRSTPPGYVLLGNPETYDRRADCWENADPEKNPYRTLTCDTSVTLEPGESWSSTLAVWGSVDDDGCMPTGTYRFESSPPHISGDCSWQFTLRFEDRQRN